MKTFNQIINDLVEAYQPEPIGQVALQGRLPCGYEMTLVQLPNNVCTITIRYGNVSSANTLQLDCNVLTAWHRGTICNEIIELTSTVEDLLGCDVAA